MLSREHLVLNREAAIAASLIGSGVTLLGKANYAQSGLYGQAFFELSIGFERAAKLIYIADYAIDHAGQYPTNTELKHQIGHDLEKLFDYTELIRDKRFPTKSDTARPGTDIHKAIVKALSEFAKSTRYYNLEAVLSRSSPSTMKDPMTQWDTTVMDPIIEKHATAARRTKIERNALMVSALMEDISTVRFTDESGNAMNTAHAASRRTGYTEITRRWVPIYVLQIARWLTLVLYELSNLGAYDHQIDGLLGLHEHFVLFMNDDSYFKSRKTWTSL